MTRINIIPVTELTDQHLIAEYREITMIPAALTRTLKSKIGLQKDKINKEYTLNTGHVYFFYDKGLYLNKRYKEIVSEMQSRGFKPNSNRKFPKNLFPSYLYNDWRPSLNEQIIIRKRIEDKIAMKPDWYRKTKKYRNSRIEPDD